MRKWWIIQLLALGTWLPLSAQEYLYEIGAAAGMGVYIGDINTRPFHNPGGAYGVMFRQHINYRWALKYNVSMARMKGSTEGWDNVLPGNAQYEFSRPLLDFGAQAEFNFFHYGVGESYKGTRRFSPYIVAGLGFSAVPRKGDGYFSLQIPMGVGLKYKIARRWNIGLEFTMRKTLGDKLDLSPEAPSPIAQYIATLPLKSAIGKKQLGPIIDMVFSRYGALKTSAVLDKIKDQGFYYSMISSVTVAISDIKDIDGKYPMVEEGYKEVEDTNSFYREGYLTAEERHRRIVEIWKGITDRIADKIKANMKADKRNPLIIMADSGSRGSVDNFKQLIGMKGLVANPKNVEIELPIVSSYREGMKVSEFFINTHGARKGSADTALKTADSGYLTRRLVDVAQDVIVREDDCHCDHGFVVREIRDTSRDTVIMKLSDRIAGRFTMHDIIDPNTGEIIVRENTLISDEQAKQVEKAGITEVEIRSVFTCQTKEGVCRHCYGLNRATGKLVEKGEAVGIMAAQSIGEPGTQLTMRVFHTGGMAGSDITQGLPRVQELVEARDPKGKAIISKFDGEVVSITPDGEKNKVRVKGSADNDFTYEPLQAARLRVKVGDHVEAGAKITDGAINPKDLLECAGVEKLEIYLIKEIQKVYAAQGIGISDKHLEVIIRQMLRKMMIIDAGDTDLLPGLKVDVERYTEANQKALEAGKRPALGQPLVLGITKAALETESFLSAASFQETTRVLTDAAIKAKTDPLHGLKENVITGKLIPAGTGLLADEEEESRLSTFTVDGDMDRVKAQYIEAHERIGD